MARAIILFLLVVAIAYSNAHPHPVDVPESQDALQKCGPNQVFNSCGSPCVDTCKQKASPVCPMMCVIGCQCKPGFVRNDKNECVLTRDCA